MRQIDIDFDVWKALTAKLQSEKQTYNDVLRSLLELESIQDPIPDPESPLGQAMNAAPAISELARFSQLKSGFYSRGLFLPEGTKLRAIYKGQLYIAQILDGQFTEPSGNTHGSPSAAAKAITGNNVNGLRFWEALLPTGGNWCRLDLLS